jgi:tripartite-type tricarboxylate transporter receptor subunit TctC
MKKKSIVLLMVLFCIASMAFSQGQEEAAADNYFDDSITFVVHAGAGGNLDLKVRLVAKYLEGIVGKPVLIENVPGGGGITAATQYLQEAPNTHKVLVMGDAMFSIAPKFNKVSYTFDDYMPIIGLDVVKACMYANSEKIKDFADFEDLISTREVLIGDNGKASGSYISQATALKKMGGSFRSITYASAAETMTSIFAGNIDVGWGAVNVGKQYVENGTLTPLMVFSDEDFVYPEGTVVPSAKSLGIDVIQENFIFFGLRAGSDPEIVSKLENAIRKVYEDPDFRADAEKMSVFLAPTNAIETKDRVNQIIRSYGDYLALLGD